MSSRASAFGGNDGARVWSALFDGFGPASLFARVCAAIAAVTACRTGPSANDGFLPTPYIAPTGPDDGDGSDDARDPTDSRDVAKVLADNRIAVTGPSSKVTRRRDSLARRPPREARGQIGRSSRAVAHEGHRRADAAGLLDHGGSRIAIGRAVGRGRRTPAGTVTRRRATMTTASASAGGPHVHERHALTRGNHESPLDEAGERVYLLPPLARRRRIAPTRGEPRASDLVYVRRAPVYGGFQ